MSKENRDLIALPQRQPPPTGGRCSGCGVSGGQTDCLYTGATGEFELTVGKRKAYAVVVDGWKVVSGSEIEAGGSVTIVVGPDETNLHLFIQVY